MYHYYNFNAFIILFLSQDGRASIQQPVFLASTALNACSGKTILILTPQFHITMVRFPKPSRKTNKPHFFFVFSGFVSMCPFFYIELLTVLTLLFYNPTVDTIFTNDKNIFSFKANIQ